MSPRSAAMATWATAWVKAPPSIVPLASGAVGSVGKSPSGICMSEKREEPQVTSTLLPDVENSTGLAGRLREMSLSRRPKTRTVPASCTSAGTVMRAETS